MRTRETVTRKQGGMLQRTLKSMVSKRFVAKFKQKYEERDIVQSDVATLRNVCKQIYKQLDYQVRRKSSTSTRPPNESPLHMLSHFKPDYFKLKAFMEDCIANIKREISHVKKHEPTAATLTEFAPSLRKHTVCALWMYHFLSWVADEMQVCLANPSEINNPNIVKFVQRIHAVDSHNFLPDLTTKNKGELYKYITKSASLIVEYEKAKKKLQRKSRGRMSGGSTGDDAMLIEPILLFMLAVVGVAMFFHPSTASNGAYMLHCLIIYIAIRNDDTLLLFLEMSNPISAG